MIPRLKTLYHKEVKTTLKEKYGFKNLNMAPKFEKVVLNMGLGIDGNDSKIFKSCEEDLAKIAGQKPVSTKFKKLSELNGKKIGSSSRRRELQLKQFNKNIKVERNFFIMVRFSLFTL